MSIKHILASGTAVIAMAGFVPSVAHAQDTTLDAATPTGAKVTKSDDEEILITGSRIKQNPNNSALPLQIITTQDLDRNGISNPEQLIGFLTANGTGADNLASNSDVISNDKRGTNGLSAANLRGQGPAATLVLLNGRRVAAHGLSGSAVDVNQIPFMAIDRVEVLKDGASAIYGTDAVGGVINFITKKDYKGFGANAYADVTGQGDSPIYRLSAIAGYGDLDKQGFNIMATVGYSWISPLQAKDRDFINTFQHDRGLGVDTRGTPFATIVYLAGTAFPTSGSMPLIPGTTTRATGGVNVLRLPGYPGCDVGTDMADYDTDVWGNPSNGLACSFDTGRNVYLQQKLNTLTYYGRGTLRLGASELSVELTGSDADSDKRFSQIQITPSSSTRNYSFKLVPGVNDAKYNYIYNAITTTLPGTVIPYGAGFSYRWRCMECGEREIFTNTKTFRASIGLEGPLAGSWDYRVGAFYAQSQSKSTLGTGYYFQDALVAALNSGYVDPFLLPGQTQSAAGLAALQAASAEGVVLYGGKYTVKSADASVSGTLFDLWGRSVKLAAGVDYRREEYKFNGDERAVQTTIFAAPFDNGNALDGVHRDIKAAYAELLVPLFDGLEVSAAGRIDDYTGFGTTTNPKFSIKYRPAKWVMFRGSYNTAFRVPTFNQIFNPQSSSTYSGADYADPRICPGGVVNATNGCPALSNSNGSAFEEIFGGNPTLGPETAQEWSAGIVFEPSPYFSLTADFWSIHRENTIQSVPLRYLFQNYDIFKDRFTYSGNDLISVNETLANIGTTETEGVDFTLRATYPAFGGRLSAGLDGTWLLKKTSQVNASAATIDELGVYTLSGDLGLRWKHNAFIAWSNEGWGLSLTQIYRSGYDNQILPGVLAGTFNPCCDTDRVKAYVIYNFSTYWTVADGFKLTFGIKNLFDKDPPFAISYSSDYGSGSNWEPRVADPRGRSFNVSAQVKF